MFIVIFYTLNNKIRTKNVHKKLSIKKSELTEMTKNRWEIGGKYMTELLESFASKKDSGKDEKSNQIIDQQTIITKKETKS